MNDAVLAHMAAACNLVATVLLILGRLAIRRRDAVRHKQLMLAALAVSAVFLVAYLSRWVLFEPRKFAGEGLIRGVYFAILVPHMALAILVAPLAIGAAMLALRGRLEAHRRLVRFAWPIWVFVSVTGVIVYGFLYHLPV
ncbi:MAG: DUF420 domain-containing protein [Myxococcales bacterium]|nr:DUF420 domain-containing protein [Myxococcales bacterium]